jgi:hypothetical protein
MMTEYMVEASEKPYYQLQIPSLRDPNLFAASSCSWHDLDAT